MPAPRAYVSIITLFALLHLIASAGAERAAAVMAWVTVLVGMVMGPFGNAATNFLNSVATNFAVQPTVTPVQPTPPTGG